MAILMPQETAKVMSIEWVAEVRGRFPYQGSAVPAVLGPLTKVNGRRPRRCKGRPMCYNLAR